MKRFLVPFFFYTLRAARGAAAPASLSELVAAAPAADWRTPDPGNLLDMDLPGGRVVIELAADFAPAHAARIRELARSGYFDGAAFVRSQDNFVVQWARPDGDPKKRTDLGKLNGEFSRALSPALKPAVLSDPDTYAPHVGFVNGFATGWDNGRIWLAHCYGMVGAGRNNDENSADASELYAVTGQSPRQLDHQITLVGKVLKGMELLSALPRGTGDLGFYKTAAEYTPITRVRLEADMLPAERAKLQVLRTEGTTFQQIIAFRRFHSDAFYHQAVGHIGLCNLVVPVRPAP
jgi:peptidylprolyl isomerase